jgi:hypothetical protein
MLQRSSCTLLSLQVKYTADNEVLVTAGYDQHVKLWDCKSRSTEAMQVMKAFKASIPTNLLKRMSS